MKLLTELLNNKRFFLDRWDRRGDHCTARTVAQPLNGSDFTRLFAMSVSVLLSNCYEIVNIASH